MSGRVGSGAVGFLGVVFLLFFVLPLLAVGGAVVGKEAESSWLPVVTDVEFSVVSQDARSATVQVYGVKRRNCAIIALSVLVRGDGEHWKLSEVVFERTGTKGDNPQSSRPVGKQDFGKWTVSPVGRDARFITRHFCHAMWESISELGTVRLGN